MNNASSNTAAASRSPLVALAALALPALAALAACTGSQVDRGAPPTGDAAQPAPGDGAAPGAPGAPEPAPAPGDATASPAPGAEPGRPGVVTPGGPKQGGGSPGVVDYACATAADCAVKNVGNCCGYYPACVNKDSATYPDQVQAECRARGMAGVCGFPEITSCACVQGRCAAGNAGK